MTIGESPGSSEAARPSGRQLRTALLTFSALLAFAANSLLCRLALAGGTLDAATFTLIRLASGAAVLALLTGRGKARPGNARQSWMAAAFLFLYAAPFSYAYRQLQAGTGALLLFGAVQITMLAGGLRAGHRPGIAQWLGLALAFAGLTYLVFPGLTAPSPPGAALMLVAGAAWGVYSLLGRNADRPLPQTAANFIRALPPAALLSLLTLPGARLAPQGILLAVCSGALASGLGYVIWYEALKGLTPATAGIVQLAVPVLTATGGIGFLGERPSWRLGIAAVLVLGGIGIALAAAWRRPAYAHA